MSGVVEPIKRGHLDSLLIILTKENKVGSSSTWEGCNKVRIREDHLVLSLEPYLSVQEFLNTMPVKNEILALVIGAMAGVLGGSFGIGGGILIVPALVVGFGFSQQKAQGTSLVALLAPVGILALIEYYKRGEADLKLGGLIALGFLFGAFGGSQLALGLDELTMRRSFAAFLVIVAAWLIFGKK